MSFQSIPILESKWKLLNEDEDKQYCDVYCLWWIQQCHMFSFIVPKGTFTLHNIRYEMERFCVKIVNSKGDTASLNGINLILVILFMPRRQKIKSSNITSPNMF